MMQNHEFLRKLAYHISPQGKHQALSDGDVEIIQFYEYSLRKSLSNSDQRRAHKVELLWLIQVYVFYTGDVSQNDIQ